MSVILQVNQNVFDNWTEYKIKILFSSWSTLEIWQFALTCLAFFTLSLSCHLLKWLVVFLKNEVYKINMDRLNEKEENVRLMKNLSIPIKESNACCLTFSYFVASLFYYTTCLLVLMACMTFNPWIFVSIVLGYSVGDVSVFK